MLTNEDKKSTKSALNIASSEFVIQIFIYFLFVLLLFFFFVTIQYVPGSHQASLQRHSVFLYRLSFECPTLRLLAGLVDDWQITFKKFLGVRCAQCNSFYRISFLLTTVMLSSLISRNRLLSMHFFFFFYNLSLLRYRMVPFVDALVVSDTCRYRFIDCSVLD